MEFTIKGAAEGVEWPPACFFEIVFYNVRGVLGMCALINQQGRSDIAGHIE